MHSGARLCLLVQLARSVCAVCCFFVPLCTYNSCGKRYIFFAFLIRARVDGHQKLFAAVHRLEAVDRRPQCQAEACVLRAFTQNRLKGAGTPACAAVQLTQPLECPLRVEVSSATERSTAAVRALATCAGEKHEAQSPGQFEFRTGFAEYCASRSTEPERHAPLVQNRESVLASPSGAHGTGEREAGRRQKELPFFRALNAFSSHHFPLCLGHLSRWGRSCM